MIVRRGERGAVQARAARIGQADTKGRISSVERRIVSREIRGRRRLTLREVAERAGLSESFLSQVERGRASASIASLRRIADGLGIGISDLFQPPRSQWVLKSEERLKEVKPLRDAWMKSIGRSKASND